MSLLTSLVSYWKLDESSGNTSDSVSANTLTNVNTATYGAGKINNGTTLVRGSTQYFNGGTTATLQPASSLTFSMWIKINNPPVSYCAIGGNTLSGQQRGFVFDMSSVGSGSQLSFHLGNGTWADISTTYTVGTWTHIVGTWDGTTVTLYKNGVSVGTPVAKASVTYTSCGFSLGNYYSDTTSAIMFDGMIDEVGLWSRALTATEVTQLYNSGEGLTYSFPSPALVNTLVVAGGGGGGLDRGGGGGAGGLISNTAFPVTPQNYPITVGTGGGPGTNGNNSVLGSLTAIGGGRGGRIAIDVNQNGANGGSGGGAGSNGGSAGPTGGTATAGQGNNGANSYGATDSPRNSGGGGGAGSAGVGGSTAPNGGTGVASSITGSALFYAAGGGGGDPGWDRPSYGKGTGGSSIGGNGGGKTDGDKNATSGAINTGSGGGGAGHGSSVGTAGSGADGVVIIAYPTGSLTATGGTVTTSGGNTIHTFTTSGTWTLTSINSQKTGFFRFM